LIVDGPRWGVNLKRVLIFLARTDDRDIVTAQAKHKEVSYDTIAYYQQTTKRKMEERTTGTSSSSSPSSKPALVFGASGEQGRSVLEGFVDAGYSPVYGVTRDAETSSDPYLSDALGCILLPGDIGDPTHVKQALSSTKAQAIFLVTTTELLENNMDTGCSTAMDAEYDTIIQFFDVLKQVYAADNLPRTVVFSTRDNVQEISNRVLAETGRAWIEPLDDGSIVPHYSGACVALLYFTLICVALI
jgi:hypothetical protein